jgi:YidC/Oxa1 family membrane protein insertase
MKQQKNVLLFFLLSLLILVGGLWLQQKLGLIPERKPREPAKPRQVAAPKPAPPLDWEKASPEQRAVVHFAARLSALAGTQSILPSTALTGVAAPPAWPIAKAPEPKPAPVVKAPTEKPAPHREFQLGHGSWPILAVLTSREAGIRQLILNKFQKANRLGEPVTLPGTRLAAPMELIPADDTLPTSYRLYLYGPDDKDRPLPYLGIEEWHVDEAACAKEIADGSEFYRQVVFYREPSPGLRITKTFRLTPGQYHIDLEVRIENHTDQPVRYQLEGPHGTPIEGEWYTSTFRNAVIGWVDAKGHALRQLEESHRIGVRAGGDAVERGGEEGIQIEYAGIAIQYFASLFVVDNQQTDRNFIERARATVESEPDPKRPQLDDITMRVVSVPVAPGATVAHKYMLYNGPVKVRLLGQFDRAVAEDLVTRYEDELHLKTLTDYHSPNWISTNIFNKIGWTTLLIACTNLMHWLLGLLHQYIMPWSYGLCIILLTVLVRGAMFPISRRQAMMSMRMQELAPELAKLKEKHKNDQQALGRATWELYGRHGVNPLGGCLPLLLQMPIFLGLYYALQESIHFRLEPLWILPRPVMGWWMQNLAAPDMLIPWSEHIPVISTPESQGSFLYLGPYFSLLPVVAVALMMVSTALMTPPPADEQQAMQQKMMKYMMIFFGLMFYKMPAGLCLYFIASSLWGLAERKLLPKRKLAAGTAGGAGGGPGPRPARPKPRGPRASGNGDGALQKVRNWWQEILKQAKKK